MPAVFLLSLLLGSQNTFANSLSYRTWQGIVDGKPSEGSFFYRLTFVNDTTLEIVKQAKNENLTEIKTVKKEAQSIEIVSSPNSKVSDFDGKKLRILDEQNIEYSNGFYRTLLKPYHKAYSLTHWILTLVVLLILNEFFRRSKLFTLFFFVILPILLTPTVWVTHDVSYWFKWVKLYSVVFAVIWFTAIRYTSISRFTWAKLIAALFLAVNIAEAVSQDFSMGYLPNIFNGIAGVLNIITLFYGWREIGPDNSNKKDMVWPKMTTFWIVAYDIWNIVYVYLNFPGSTSMQLMVLLSCTIPALFIKKGAWLQARAFTLAAWFMYYFTFPRFTEQMEVMFPRNTQIMVLVASISLAVNVAYLFVFLQKLKIKPLGFGFFKTKV